MSEAFGLVNALSGFRGQISNMFALKLRSGSYSGRTVALTLKFEDANG